MENENENEITQAEIQQEPVEEIQQVEYQEQEEQSNKLMAFLDTITEGKEEPQPEDEAVHAEAPEILGEPKELVQPLAPKTEEQEEAEILQEVKSERGQNRIRELINERKELRDVNQGIMDIVQKTNMAPEAWAETIEFCRLASSQSETDLHLALRMLDDQRTALCKRLGVAAPGVDPLEDFPDLRQQVEAMEIPVDRALELAKHRSNEQRKQMEAQQHWEKEQQSRSYQQQLGLFQQQAMGFFGSKAADLDYKAKEKKIVEYFQQPGNLQRFVRTYEPHQWLPQLQFMYENVSPPPQNRATVQPLRSRPANVGSANPTLTGVDRVMATLDSLGI